MPGGFNHADIFARAAVGDGRFVGVQFDDGVIDAASGEGRQDVLDGVDFGVASCQRGGAVGGADVIHSGFDLRFAFQIRAPEADARTGGGREKSHIDTNAGMKSNAGETRRPPQSLLMHAGNLTPSRSLARFRSSRACHR